jgi:hypothetical protein
MLEEPLTYNPQVGKIKGCFTRVSGLAKEVVIENINSYVSIRPSKKHSIMKSTKA